MESLILKEKRKSIRVPVELTVLGEIDDQRVAMCSENISLDGMFLFSREFVRPRAIFSARIWLSNDEEPIQAYLTSCFTERTWTGYGIGTYISGISAKDSAVWETFYRCCASSRSDQLRQLVQSEKTVRNRRVVVVAGSLSPLAMQALRKQGLDVTSVPTVGDAVDLVQRTPVEAVVSDLHCPGLDGLALCCQVNGRRLPTRTILLTDSAGPREFLLGLYAGATRVIAKPCSHDTLVARILEVLQQRLPAGRKSPVDPDTAALASGDANPLGTLADGAGAHHPIDALRSVGRRATQGLGQVYRFVSDRVAGRPSL